MKKGSRKSLPDRIARSMGASASAIYLALSNTMSAAAFSYNQAVVNNNMSTDPTVMMGKAIGMVLMIVTAVGVGALIIGFVDLAQAFTSDQPDKRAKGFNYIAGGAIMIGLRVILQLMGILVS